MSNTTTHTDTRTYIAIRMATGKAVHLRAEGSSQTECSRWIGHTRQYTTDEKVITCAGCARNLQYRPDAIAQGFTKAEVAR